MSYTNPIEGATYPVTLPADMANINNGIVEVGLDALTKVINERDALLEACEEALNEFERITGDIGFEPDRFRERLAILQSLAGAIAKAKG